MPGSFFCLALQGSGGFPVTVVGTSGVAFEVWKRWLLSPELACTWVPWPVVGRSPFPSVFPASSFLSLLGGPSPDTGAQMLRFSGSLLGPAEPSACLSLDPHCSLPPPPPAPGLSTPHHSHCSSLNCLQLGCITAIMRCLRLNAVGSAGQNSRPGAQETGWSKHGGFPSWLWNPPVAPTRPASPSVILGPTAWIPRVMA